jgi:hypothetical protein
MEHTQRLQMVELSDTFLKITVFIMFKGAKNDWKFWKKIGKYKKNDIDNSNRNEVKKLELKI